MELTGNMQRFYTHIYTHNSPCTHILTLSCMHTPINTHRHTDTDTQTHRHTHTHTRTHTHMRKGREECTRKQGSCVTRVLPPRTLSVATFCNTFCNTFCISSWTSHSVAYCSRVGIEFHPLVSTVWAAFWGREIGSAHV